MSVIALPFYNSQELNNCFENAKLLSVLPEYKPLFKNEPTSDKFKKNTVDEHRGLHHTLYYNPEDRTLNIYYRSVKDSSEEIVVIVNKTTIVNIQTTPYNWHIRPLGIFDEINHVRVDNSQKVIYEKTFDSEFREVFKIKSYIGNV